MSYRQTLRRLDELFLEDLLDMSSSSRNQSEMDSSSEDSSEMDSSSEDSLDMDSSLNLFVAPLNKTVDDKKLRTAFKKYGEIILADVARDENGLSKGYGFVNFRSAYDGLRAKKEMNNKNLFGTTIRVKIGQKQEESCYENRRGNITWASNWKTKSDDVQEQESDSDTQSNYSDATTHESNSDETHNIGARIRKLFESQSCTDVMFYQKNNRKKFILAHRVILAAGSPVLMKRFFHDKENVAVGDKLEFEVSTLPFDAFTCIVKYLYTDEVAFEDETLVQGILKGAKLFDIWPLVNKCEEYFENIELTSNNVCSKLQMSLSNEIVALKERCIEYIQRNTLSVIQSTEFLKCNFSTVRAICKLESLKLRSEKELIEAAMKWLHSKSNIEKKTLLIPLLTSFRFLTITAGEMSEIIQKNPQLMTSEEGLNIMMFLYSSSENPNFSLLPFWCNKNMQSRCFFQAVSRTGLNTAKSDGKLTDKILIPLKSDPGQGFVSKLTSLLKMKCISGFHQIKAIRLNFEKPISDKCQINDVFIKAVTGHSGFVITEKRQIVDEESVRVEFRRKIKVRRGDTLDIKVEAKSIKCYKFLQFDEACSMPANPHFKVSISSLPKQRKLYFVSEIEYGPQEKPKFYSKKIGKKK